MSCYNWERGTFTFSVAEFRRFKVELFAVLNKALEADFATANRLYEALVAKGKGRRKFNWQEAFEALLDETVTTYGGGVFGYSSTQPKYKFRAVSSFNVREAMLSKPQLDEQGKPTGRRVDCSPRKPMKKDFAPLSVSKTHHVSDADQEASLSFDAAKRQVTWSVSENNRAVERARESGLGRTFFDLLSKVKWTRATGGYIVGNDEYRRDNREAGGGANELKERFGPLGEQEWEAQYARLGLRSRPKARTLALARAR